jgi:hypothetical protein
MNEIAAAYEEWDTVKAQGVLDKASCPAPKRKWAANAEENLAEGSLCPRKRKDAVDETSRTQNEASLRTLFIT